MLTIVAANGFSTFRKRVEERRKVLEKRQNARVKRVRHDFARIKQDFDRIATREAELSKSLVDDLIPFRLVWNEEALTKMKTYMPFTLEDKNQNQDQDQDQDFEILP